MLSRIMEGIIVDDDHLGLEVLKKVGPGGNFLAERHTLQNLVKEHFIPRLFNREPRRIWLEQGSKDIAEIASLEVSKILQTHHPPPLDTDIQNDLVKIIHEIKQRK